MSKKLLFSALLGSTAWLVQGILADAQTGPVREGLRRTGEAVAEGTRAAVRGTGQAIGQAGQAVRDTVNSPADAARAQVDRGERSELEVRGSEPMLDPTADASVDANVGPAQIQADAGLDTNQQLNAEGQFQGQPNDQYQSGFRGVDGQIASDQQQMSGSFQKRSQVEHNGRMYNVRTSREGRPFICVGGCPVYLDQTQSSGQPHEAYRMDSDQPQQGLEHHLNSQQYPQDNLQGGTYAPQGGPGAPPAPPTPIRSDIQNGSTGLNAGAQIETDQTIDAGQNRNLSGSADANIGADANADNAGLRASGSSDISGSASGAAAGASASGSASAPQAGSLNASGDASTSSSDSSNDASSEQGSSSDSNQSDADSGSDSSSSGASSSGSGT